MKITFDFIIFSQNCFCNFVRLDLCKQNISFPVMHINGKKVHMRLSLGANILVLASFRFFSRSLLPNLEV